MQVSGGRRFFGLAAGVIVGWDKDGGSSTGAFHRDQGIHSDVPFPVVTAPAKVGSSSMKRLTASTTAIGSLARRSPGRYFCAATEYSTFVLRVLRKSSSVSPRIAA